VSYIDNDLKELVIDEGETRPTAGFQRVIQRAVIHVQSSGREEVTGANVLVAILPNLQSTEGSWPSGSVSSANGRGREERLAAAVRECTSAQISRRPPTSSIFKAAVILPNFGRHSVI
jgi:ATP-dependent Clp protease ATP-binding subunit ClpA